MSLNVRVITPEKILLKATVEKLILPTSTGQICILKNHAPLLTVLDIGIMQLQGDSGTTSFVLVDGFATVEANEILILCTTAEASTSIDIKAVQKEIGDVRLLIEKVKTPREKTELTLRLRKAKTRLEAVS